MLQRYINDLYGSKGELLMTVHKSKKLTGTDLLSKIKKGKNVTNFVVNYSFYKAKKPLKLKKV